MKTPREKAFFYFRISVYDIVLITKRHFAKTKETSLCGKDRKTCELSSRTLDATALGRWSPFDIRSYGGG